MTEEEAREKARNELYGEDYSEYYLDRAKLKAIRLARGMTQQKLAEAVGYSNAYAIHTLESSNSKRAVKGVPVTILRMITDTLGVPIESVLVKKPGWLIEKEAKERAERGEDR